ncbi:hypothetical protein CW304_09375 [Bacillus sp. UFRGS-B20]|nr:hypothetical protein CW304_09375 [Bacillus sp. UFRGS-B20]
MKLWSFLQLLTLTILLVAVFASDARALSGMHNFSSSILWQLTALLYDFLFLAIKYVHSSFFRNLNLLNIIGRGSTFHLVSGEKIHGKGDF